MKNVHQIRKMFKKVLFLTRNFRGCNYKTFLIRRKFDYKAFFEFIENSIIKHFGQLLLSKVAENVI